MSTRTRLSDEYNLTDETVNKLCYAIIKRAVLDYYQDCVMPEVLPPRPKCVDYIRGKKVYRYMTDHERHQLLVAMEKDRKIRRDKELKFFHSAWYRLLATEGNATKHAVEIDVILNEIKRRRMAGLTPFEKDDEALEEAEVVNYGDPCDDLGRIGNGQIRKHEKL